MPYQTQTESGFLMIVPDKKNKKLLTSSNQKKKFYVSKEIDGKELYKGEIPEWLFRRIAELIIREEKDAKKNS